MSGLPPLSAWQKLAAARDQRRIELEHCVRWFVGTSAVLSARRRGRPLNLDLLTRHAHHEGAMRGALFRSRELDKMLDDELHAVIDAASTGRAA